jgi:SEC-C motif
MRLDPLNVRMTDVVMDVGQRGDYTGPVHQLLTIGEPNSYDPAEWPDYAAEFGIGHEQVAALIRLACDPALQHGESDSSEVWAPMHAWRALGQLRAEAAVAPLLALAKMIEWDEAADQELPVVFGMIGPAAIPYIGAFLANRENSESPVATAISGLTEIAARYADRRGECIDILVRTLEPHEDTNRTINGFAISALIDLRAVEAIVTIRNAFRRNAVDLTIAGDTEDVEIELGLRDRRATPKPHYAILPADWLPWPGADRIQPAMHELPKREKKVGRNEPCPCGSGKKYKKCCLQ